LFASILTPFIPVTVVFTVCLLVLGLGHYLLIARRQDLGNEARLPRQLVLFGLTLLALLLMVIAAPLPESTRNQILALFGIAISGVIALASASFVTNFMAAVMLRVTKPFKVGDFITVGEHFGKVSERGLFDTEIQTENRELIAIPNATFINQPVTVARSSGVIVWTTLSLGYDVATGQVEPLMLKAAADAGLSDPYVHITSLGDFSITYRVCGLLEDVEGILTTRSELNRQLLNKLHGANIEIVSPTITRHITMPEDTHIVPGQFAIDATRPTVKAEEIVFDKAREIGRLEAEKKQLEEQLNALKEAGESPPERIGEQLAALVAELSALREET